MTVHAPGQGGTAQQQAPGDGTDRPGRLLPGWAKVLVVVAHPDDESFGLGAIISQMTATGAAAHILCYTHGEASTLNENRTALAAHAVELAVRHRPDGLLVVDDTGVTSHPDHQAATRAAVLAARAAGLPVLAWALPTAIADRLRAETGHPFTGQPPHRLDLCIRVDRTRQRRAALAHASQISPSAVIWRRWQLQGDREHLRWLLPPPA